MESMEQQRMDIRAFSTYLKASQLGSLLDEAYGAGKTESEAPRLFAVYESYQKGDLNLQEMAKEMNLTTLGLDSEKIKRWLPKLVPRHALGCKVQVVEITPRTKGFEDEAKDWAARGGQIKDIKGGELTI